MSSGSVPQSPPRGQSGPRSIVGPLLFALLWQLALHALGGLPEATAQNRDAFKQGIEAIDLERFAQAVEPLRRAVAEDGRESDERVFLSGVFSRPYLPHFFLGWALYRSGTENCEDALTALAESSRQGVIEGFGRIRADLESAREACNRVLLPQAESAALGQLERVEGLVDRLARPLPTPGPEADRQRLLDRVADTRSRLESATARQDPLAMAAATTELATLADALDNLLRTQASLAEARSANAFSVASGAARDAIAEAARSRRQVLDLLADPLHGEARSGQLGSESASLATELEGIRQRLASAATPDQARTAASEAESIGQQFEQLIERASAIRVVESTAPPPDEDRPSRPVEDPVANRNTQPPPPATPSADPALLRSLSERSRGASVLLREIRERGELADPGRLLQLQVDRLQATIGEAEAWRGQPDRRRHRELLLRLRDSENAIRILVGTERLFTGDPRGALAILGVVEIGDAPVFAHLRLVRAASHFELFRLGGELDLDRRRRAADEVLECHRSAPRLVPSPEPFSPAFRSFFDQTIGDSKAAGE